jgi:hypothetical protein
MEQLVEEELKLKAEIERDTHLEAVSHQTLRVTCLLTS